MKLLRSQRTLRLVLALIVGAACVWLFAHVRDKQRHAGHRPVVSFATVKPVLEGLANELPPELKEPNEAKWKAWAQHKDDIIRARLEQGALDSLINLLLFGTSFTTQPRVMTMHDSDDAVVQSRLNDLLQGLRNPGKNERLIFLRNILRGSGMDPDSSAGTRRQKLSSWKIFDGLSRSRSLFTNSLMRQPATATKRPGFPSARMCFAIAASRLIQPFCRASGSRARCAT